MNAIFHLAAMMSFVWLLYANLCLRRQRDLLRQLVQAGRLDAASGPQRVRVASPQVFLRQFAEAMAVPFVAEAGPAAPQRIDARPWFDLFSRTSLRLIRWRRADAASGAIMVEVEVAGASADAGLAAMAAALSQAFGGRTEVVLRRQAHAQGSGKLDGDS